MPTIIRCGAEVPISKPTLKVDQDVVTVGHLLSKSCVCRKVQAVEVV